MIQELIVEQGVKPFIYEPWTQFKEQPYTGRYQNVSEYGFRYVSEQGPWPPDPRNVNIVLFGGSTTHGYGVSDEETIASHLQQFCRFDNGTSQVCVYNFGRGTHYSSQERILFERLLVAKLPFHVAVFIDGLNDFAYAKDEPYFTEKIRRVFDFPKPAHPLSFLPIGQLILNAQDTSADRDQSDPFVDDDDIEHTYTVINRYIMNKKLIEGAASRFNVDVFFVWQPIPTFKYDLRYHPFARHGFGKRKHGRFGYPHMEKIRGDLEGNFLWLANMQENMNEPLYVDTFHYSGKMSRVIASEIHTFLLARGAFRNRASTSKTGNTD